MFYWIFELEYSKAIVIYVINALQFVLLESFTQNIRILNFGTKNALFGCFVEQLWKSIVIFVINAL